MMASAKLVITNIGQILSGKLEAPILDGDCVIAVDGRITGIGYAKDMELDNATVHVHAHGVTLTPGGSRLTGLDGRPPAAPTGH